MATERELELLDDYLSGKMDGAARESFENALKADPALQSELTLQKHIIEGIKQARVAALKSALNNVAIPPAMSITTKATLWVLAAGIVGLSLYYLWPQAEPTAKPAITTEQHKEVVTKPESAEVPILAEESSDNDKSSEVKPSIESKSENAIQKPLKNTETKVPAKQPNPSPFIPGDDEVSIQAEKPEVIEGISVPNSNRKITEPEIVEDDKKLKFHYQFDDGKLILYGSFRKNLYDILEFFENDQLFLYFDNRYYVLDKTKIKPTPLKEITDESLIKKLDESREK